jgi:hypothetical protein
MHQQRHGGGRNQRTERGEYGDDEAFPVQFAEVQQKGAGKEQQRKHAVQDQRLEIDLLHQAKRRRMQARSIACDGFERQRGGHRQQDRADGQRQPQHSDCEPSEDSRNGDKRADQLQGGHIRQCTRVWRGR